MPTDHDIIFHSEESGATKVSLMLDGKDVSRLWIIPYVIRVGAATLRMDGIGGVGTEDAHRNNGYSRRVLEASVEFMRHRSDAAVSMLYGIPNYYTKFGYATAGPMCWVTLGTLPPDAPLPDGWQARPFQPDDLPVLKQLYERVTARGVGPAVRADEARAWRKLTESAPAAKADAAAPAEPECRVVVDPAGALVGYAWYGTDFWYRRNLNRDQPEWLVFGEVMAATPEAASVILDVCQRWGSSPTATPTGPAKRVCITNPPDHPVVRAATYTWSSVTLRYAENGDSMARVMDVGRLLSALEPELATRVTAARWVRDVTLAVRTDIGTGYLNVGRGACAYRAAQPAGAGDRATFDVPQAALARLVFGAAEPQEIVERLDHPPTGVAAELVEVLFPRRHQHMYLPDRY